MFSQALSPSRSFGVATLERLSRLDFAENVLLAVHCVKTSCVLSEGRALFFKIGLLMQRSLLLNGLRKSKVCGSCWRVGVKEERSVIEADPCFAKRLLFCAAVVHQLLYVEFFAVSLQIKEHVCVPIVDVRRLAPRRKRRILLHCRLQRALVKVLERFEPVDALAHLRLAQNVERDVR